LEEKTGGNLPHPGKGEEERSEDEGEAPTGEGGRFKTFPEKDGAVGEWQAEEPAGVAVAIEGDVGGHRDREDQHHQKAKKHHVDESVAEERPGGGERGDVLQALAEEP